MGLSFLYLPRDLRPDDEIALDLMGGAVTACPGWGYGGGVFAIEACAQGMGGWLSATHRSVTNPLQKERSWWSLGAILRAAVRLGAGFSLELDAGLAVPLIERRFITTTPERTVGETPTVSTVVGLNLVRGL